MGLASKLMPELVEWDLGDLEYQNADEYRRSNPHWSLHQDGAPGGESVTDVTVRANVVREAWLDSSADLVIVVSHGQFIKALAAVLLDQDPRFAARLSLGPARAAHFLRRATGTSLVGWNLSPSEPDLWKDLT
jgi:probable phosphoglycerate mutase